MHDELIDLFGERIELKLNERLGRVTQRSGYYKRDYMLAIGKIKLKVPHTRDGKFSPTLFERYQRTDMAFILSMIEMVLQGVSTRRVTKIVEELVGQSVSASFVSSLIKKLDPVVKEWANRSLKHCTYAFLHVEWMRCILKSVKHAKSSDLK